VRSCSAVPSTNTDKFSGRVDKPFLKAGRKYHAMKAKRNSWPRTRGVAMNPVDRKPHWSLSQTLADFQIPTEEVTTSTLVTLRPWPETHPPVKRLVLSPPGEPVSSGVPSTSLPPTSKRIDGFDELDMEVWIFGLTCNTYASVYTEDLLLASTGVLSYLFAFLGPCCPPKSEAKQSKRRSWDPRSL
jgi:hypothetical protein